MSAGGMHKKELSLRKEHVFVVGKYVEDVKQDERSGFGSCGIDNEASWSCKRLVTEDFVQIESI